jgi:hypothetical protein
MKQAQRYCGGISCLLIASSFINAAHGFERASWQSQANGAAREQDGGNDTAVKMDLVLSYYDEPLQEVLIFVERAKHAVYQQGVGHVQVFFYCQGDVERHLLPEEWIFKRLTNVNREAHVYAAYLHEHRSRDTQYVWFTQALPNGDKEHSRYLWSRLKHLTSSTGMLALCGVGESSCDYWDQGSRVTAIYAMTQSRLCTDADTWTVFFNGEFIVSRARIMRRSQTFYDGIWEASQTPSAFRRMDEKSAGHNVSEYAFAFVMERSWNLVFDCLKPDYVPKKYVSDLLHKKREFRCGM